MILILAICFQVILDEGHQIKNGNSGLAKSINAIKTQRRIILTGSCFATP